MANAPVNYGRASEEPSGSEPAWQRPFEPNSGVDDGMDVRQLLATLRAGWLFVLAVGLGTLLVVLAVTAVSDMEFRTRGRLYLGELNHAASGSQLREIDLSEESTGDVGSEIEILKSHTLIAQAVLDSGLNVSIAPAGSKPPVYLQWRLSGRDPNLLDATRGRLVPKDAVLTDPAALSRDFNLHFQTDKIYEVGSGGARLGKGKLDEPLAVPGLRMTLQRSAVAGPRAGDRYDMTVTSVDATSQSVLKNLIVTVPKSVGSTQPVKVVTLEFAHGSPRLAATFLDKLMAAYLAERQEWKTEAATAAEAFVTRQLESMRSSLEKTEKKLAEYRENTRVVVLSDEAKAMVGQIAKYEEQRVGAQLQVSSLAQMHKAFADPSRPMEAYLVGEVNDSVLSGLASSLSQAQQDLAKLEEQFSPDAREVRQQRAQVDAQREMVKKYVSSRLSRAQEQLGSISGVIGQFEAKLKSVPGAELTLAQLMRDTEVYSKMYSFLLQRQQQATMIKGSTISRNRVLDKPEMPYREDAPRLSLRLGSGLLGLLLGAAFLLLRRWFGGTFLNTDDAHVAAGNVPVLAHVPRRRRRLSARQLAAGDTLSGKLQPAFAEAFRALRTNVYALLGERERVLLITSPAPGDGKTLSAYSLAAILVADHKRVLVLDAAAPDQSKNKLPSVPGLSNALRGECELKDVIRCVDTPFGEVARVSAGTPRPDGAGGASRDAWARVLAEARIHFDFVILDAPSYPLSSDTLQLAAEADLVLSIVRLRHTPRTLVEAHLRAVCGWSRRCAVVLNDVRSSAGFPQMHTPRRMGTPRRSLTPLRVIHPYIPT